MANSYVQISRDYESKNNLQNQPLSQFYTTEVSFRINTMSPLLKYSTLKRAIALYQNGVYIKTVFIPKRCLYQNGVYIKTGHKAHLWNGLSIWSHWSRWFTKVVCTVTALSSHGNACVYNARRCVSSGQGTHPCHYDYHVMLFIMMKSSNGNIFRVTGPLCGEFPGHRWIPLTKASDAELWCFLWSASE